jgi:hypothetical protein
MYKPVAIVVWAATACNPNSMNVLTNERLPERLILCATDTFYLDGDTCLSQLPDVMQLRIEEETGCYSCILDLITSLHSASDLEKTTCSLDPSGIECLSTVTISAGLRDFQGCSGYSLIYPSCSSWEVRRSVSIIQDILALLVSTSEQNLGQLGLPEEPCNLCYVNFYTSLRSAVNADPTLKASIETCVSISLSDPDCQSGLEMYRERFRSCSGYDLMYLGPECTSGAVLEIEAIDPVPALTGCAFHPEAPSCIAVDAVFQSIKSISSAECTRCYTEYFDDLRVRRAIVSAGSVCDDLSSQACQDWIALETSNLQQCVR